MQELNKYQTPLTEELKEALPKEVWEELLEYIATVPFIQTLIDKKRTTVTSRPIMKEYFGVDDNGKDIFKPDRRGRREIDVTNPHLLEDIDFFRQRALFHQKHGIYTAIPPNANKNSSYAKFWKEELRRWKYGLVRESDGEWIPGNLYFYWNYSPIKLNIVSSTSKSVKKKAERIREFPFPWLGDYLFFHYLDQAREAGQHAKLLKTRGVGFSFKFGSISPCNMYTRPGLPNFHLASDKTFLSGEKGIYGKVLDTLDWIAEHTPLPKIRLLNKLAGMEVQLGFQDQYGVQKGLKSSVFGISLKDNPDKARGVRGPLIHYEEDGLFPNLETAWNVNREAVESGHAVHGMMVAGGTGGTTGANFIGSEKLFYNGDAYNIYMLNNVFDRNPGEGSRCAFFWPTYLNRAECYDHSNGEPDVIKAMVEVLQERHLIKYGSADPLAITQKKAEAPVTPQEAVMRTSGTLFPVADIKEYLESIAVKRDSFVAEHLVGALVYGENGEVKFRPRSDVAPLRSYSMVDVLNREGALEIFEPPKLGKDGLAMRGRYIAGIDPVDDDTGESLYSILVMDTFTDRIVAEYTGRPKLAKQAYEITLRLLKYYNAVANYESNFKGLFSYFSNNNALYLLVDTPQILKDMELVKAVNAYGNKAKGTRANLQINAWGRKLQADWMLERVEGEENLKLRTIRSIAYLEEAMSWNADGNFDRVSAGGMLMILREEYYKRITANRESGGEPIASLADDPFFARNYRPKQKENSYIADTNVLKNIGNRLEIE